MAPHTMLSLALTTLLALPSPCHAKSLWSPSPAPSSDVIRTAYPLSNARLAALIHGPPGAEILTLNLDTLWSGGPFESATYSGGNPNSSVADVLPGIRDWIFQNATGNVTGLLGGDGEFGSYRVLGNLSVVVPEVVGNASVEGYKRALDLATGLHSTAFSARGRDVQTRAFCSHPDQVCVYTLSSTRGVPPLDIRLDNTLAGPELQSATCVDGSSGNGTAHVRLRGVTQLGPPTGMRYDAIARVAAGGRVTASCEAGALRVVSANGTTSVTVVVGAGSDYDAKKGTAEYEFSYRGADPGPGVEAGTRAAAAKTGEQLEDAHVADFAALTGRFTLSLPDPLGSADTPTEEVIARYSEDDAAGDPWLEGLLFDYATYLFVSSSRPGSLPPNLQGRWSEGLWAAWSGDYHANINLQMNHWTPDQTGLTDLQTPLWDYMADNWVPRGRETARLLYGAPGWVVHNEMNIFGHTGMKSGASWANYAAAAAWMMQHVFDHWEYSQDAAWLRDQGYPLLKGVAEFWLHQLQVDDYTNDGSLVVNPCNSPEHGPTSFGCAHFQQLIHQVFDNTLALASPAAEADDAFTANVTAALARLDKGVHIGAWGQLKEWKMPDTLGYEPMNDTHRHLSELVGWHPGYSVSGLAGGYSNATIQDAVAQKLYSRGEGNAPDANAGWAKVWRSACWARLNNTERAHFELRYAIAENFVGNGFSMYSGLNTPFQIDANYGLGGAVLSMLVVDLPNAFGDTGIRTVVLGPAIPAAWAGGSVRGLVLRGGGTVNFGWDDAGLVTEATVEGRSAPVRIVNKAGRVLAEV